MSEVLLNVRDIRMGSKRSIGSYPNYETFYNLLMKQLEKRGIKIEDNLNKEKIRKLIDQYKKKNLN